MTVIPHFHGIPSRKAIYGITFVIQGDLQGQEVCSKVKLLKILFPINTDRGSEILICYVILNRESICGDSFGDFKDILSIKK